MKSIGYVFQVALAACLFFKDRFSVPFGSTIGLFWSSRTVPLISSSFIPAISSLLLSKLKQVWPIHEKETFSVCICTNIAKDTILLI